jgi:heterodisulfide reductase subunit B
VTAVADALGIKLIEPAGWTCCGSTPAHQTDRILALSLAASNLLRVKDMGLDMVVNCAACFSRMKAANHEISADPEMRRKVADVLGRDYDGSTKVRHFIEILLDDAGADLIRKSATHILGGLKVAPYYGCLLVRPPDVTGFDDPENPTSMDRIVRILGGESIDWPHRTECCGAGLTLTRTDIVVDLSDKILSMAKDAGAQCVVVACPMCQMNLDMRQLDIEKSTGRRHGMPVLYISQLIGLCLGIKPGKLGLRKLMISPSAVVEAVCAG